MPSHFKYRIKKVSENQKSVWDYDSVPAELKQSCLDSGAYTDTDKNIVPGTCAFVIKVRSEGATRYLCGIKVYANRTSLIASNERTATPTQDGSGEGRVSGATKLPEDDEFYLTLFNCKYIDTYSAKAAKEGVSTEETTLFPMCNCYSPRGGLAVTHFDGAVKDSEAPGYAPSEGVILPKSYDVYKNPANDPYMSGPIPKYLMNNARNRFPQAPPKLGFIYLMMNARASLIPCCWWIGKGPILYRADHFRVIDLAVAQEYFKKTAGGNPSHSTKWGISNVADYTYREGDYFYPNEGDNYLKNILLGRNYDPTLPNCGNNQRIIYTLDTKVASALTKNPITGDTTCKDIPWHFDSGLGLSPRNCGHPDCLVKYQWGSVCNGGGSFDLANGRACPYYENPLMGPEVTSDKQCTMSKMYAGDSITGAALLEMMWLAKGGLPWTQEEWESVWRVPYIWATIPFNPKRGYSDTFRDPDGNLQRIEGIQIPEYKVYAVKTSVDLVTGLAKQEPPQLLPGGSVSQYKRPPDGAGLVSGKQIPDLPTLVQEIEIKPIGSLNLVWPIADLSLLGLKIERTEDFLEKLKQARSRPYTHLVWGPESKNILVMGYGTGGQFLNGVYCVNLAMMIGKWKEKKDRLITLLEDLDLAKPETQALLKELRRDLMSSQVAGAEKVIDGMEMQRALLDPRGMFIFKSVPLNLLFEENIVLVFGFSSSSAISASFTKIKPVFKRAYLYQSKASLMSGWKATWNGRPSLFFNENEFKDIAGEDYGTQKGAKVDVSLTKSKVPSSNLTGTETLEELTDRADTLAVDLQALNKAYSDTQDMVVKGNYVNQISSKTEALNRVQELISARTASATESTSSSVIQDYGTERLRLEGSMEEIDREIKHLKEKESTASGSGLTNLAKFYNGLVAELQYDKAFLQRQLNLIPQEGEQQPATSEDRKTNWCVQVNYDDGDPDTDEGGSLDTKKEGEDKTQVGQGDVSRIYAPFLNYRRKYQKDLGSYKSVLPGGASQDPPKLRILKDSGIAEWKYFELGREGTDSTLNPLWTFAPSGAKRVVVYRAKGAEVTEELGRWYTMASCSSMIVLILNPELANRHNEFMIFNMWAEVDYSWKNASGEMETLKKKVKFAPFNYTQVNRTFPGFNAGKTAELLSGTMGKFGVTHEKISVSENVEILEKPESNRHPWVIFATACEEKSDLKSWPAYNGQWYPGGSLYIASLPQKDNVKLFMDYAFIGEVYDQDDRKFLDWEDGADSHKTRILFNHPRAGTIRTVFTTGEGNIGELGDSQEDGLVDGFKKVPMGSSALTAMWPYARLTCRDFEMHYVWRDDQDNHQVCDNYVMAGFKATGPRETVGQNKRFTYYTHGDHDLGTVFTPKITFGQWVGRGIDRTWEEQEMNYSWNTGAKVQAGDPTESFPSECKESNTPGNKEGPLYYPYTRSEPHSKFVPIHPVYIWDFLVHYRNKPKSAKYFGGFRMLATDTCHLGVQETRGNSTWEVSYRLNTKDPTKYMGRCRTRGPLFQLEYDDYEEKKPKTVFFSPFAARDRSSTGATWMYYLRASTSDGENPDTSDTWVPQQAEIAERDTAKVADNPNNLSEGVWKAICRSLYMTWVAGDTSAYWDLLEQKNWGDQRGWGVTIDGGLKFTNEQVFTPPEMPDSTAARRAFLTDQIQFYNNWLSKLEQDRAAAGDTVAESQILIDIETYKNTRDTLQSELDDLGDGSSAPTPGETPAEDQTPPAKPEEEQLQIDLVTGCHKTTVKDIGQRGSFFFDNTYMPGSVTSEEAKAKLQEDTRKEYDKMKNKVQRLYYYEQKSFGLNLPWSPYDSPPLFGNTGREMYIVELCTVGSVISWLPTTDPKATMTEGKTAVPSWWTAREPLGDPVEMITLLPPPTECTRAVMPLSTESQNPFYSYILDGDTFNEVEPDFETEYKPHEIRIATKHDVDSYGKAWYRSDVGRMTLTLTKDSKLTNIKVFGDSPATQQSTYTSITTAAVVDGNPAQAASPNAGDTARDSTLPRNALLGKDIKGIAVEGGQKVFVGQTFPGYYSPYVHGKTFISFRGGRSGTNIHWAWPKSNRDLITRGKKFIKWWSDIPDLGSKDKSEVKTEIKEEYQIDSISSIQCCPYVQKHPTADDGREISLGPILKKEAQPKDERESIFKDKTYYAIVVESERNKGGRSRPPIIWAQQVDSPDKVSNASEFKGPKAGAVPYRVNWDGTITAVTLGKDDEKDDSIFTSGALFPRVLRNTTPGGNFITSDQANESGKFPAFDLGLLSYRHLGKVFTTKDIGSNNETFKKIRVRKTKNRYGYNSHLVEAELRLPNLGCDVLHIEITFNEFFYSSIESLFAKGNDGASVELVVEGDPVAGTDYMGDKYYKNYIKKLPLEEGVDLRDNKVFYDLDLGMAKNMKLKFLWYIKCSTTKFDEGIWRGDETKYNNDTKKMEPVTENFCYLPDLVEKITLGTLLAGKCAEVVEIKEAPFIVSTGSFSEKEELQYDLASEAKSEWYKCTWESSDKNIERKWDQKSLYQSRVTRGAPKTEEWARGGYEEMQKSFSDIGLNYNKLPKAREFENSCVELPELPQSRLKMKAWEDNVKPDSNGRTWTWGGIWTTRVAGPEWRTSDENPTRDFIWWPAPHYYSGKIIMKGRAWFFGDQYKDEAKVMTERREVPKEDKYNQTAYKNELSAYDKLLRNIQEFEVYRSGLRASAASTAARNRQTINNRKQAASQKSMDRMWQSMTAGRPSAGAPPPVMLGTRNYMVNEYKEYAYLDEVGLSPDKASWSDIKDKEENMQKDLYEEAKKLGTDNIGNDTITARAIIPYYDWHALMELSGKSWQDRNGAGDYEALTEDDLKDIQDSECEFIWKTWDWEEVQSFTFRDEYKAAYKPEGDLSQTGLLRRCGRRWTIFDKSKEKTQKNMFVEAIDLLDGDFKTALNNAKGEAKSDRVKGDIDTLLQFVEDTKDELTDMKDYYAALAQKLWAHISTAMRLDTSRPQTYYKSNSVIEALEAAITKTPEDVTSVNASVSTLEDSDVVSRELNKAVLKVIGLLKTIPATLDTWRPQYQQVKNDMSYYNNTTEQLLTNSRKLVGALGINTRDDSKMVRTGIIDCHGDDDTDPKGDCDKDGYPQKGEWDTERDSSSDWPSNISDDGGDSLKRPDPWWRF